jgi:hypothetical protein
MPESFKTKKTPFGLDWWDKNWRLFFQENSGPVLHKVTLGKADSKPNFGESRCIELTVLLTKKLRFKKVPFLISFSFCLLLENQFNNKKNTPAKSQGIEMRMPELISFSGIQAE